MKKEKGFSLSLKDCKILFALLNVGFYTEKETRKYKNIRKHLKRFGISDSEALALENRLWKYCNWIINESDE